MNSFWKACYNFCILPLLWGVIRLLGLVRAKVRRGIRARSGLFTALRRELDALRPGKRVWFHASSMGEFEQAKPIIASLKERYADIRIIVTFFSPSGYENSRRYQLADVISYIPFDTASNARRFVEMVRPDCAVIIRYDVWPNHLWELERRGIPVLMANATMRMNSKRRIPVVRNFHHHVYNALQHILTVSEADATAFGVFKLTRPKVEAIGDTRYDQVSIRSREASKRHVLAESIVAGKSVLVAGSSWPEDEEVFLPVVLKLQESISNLLTIVVPHEPSLDHLEELEARLAGRSSSIRFSALNDYSGEPIIIVDSIGILLSLYAYAHLAYIGGSFKQNVHNVLEAAVYGIPVVFGPKHKNSQEAILLATSGGGFVVDDMQSMYRILRTLLGDSTKRHAAGTTAREFVASHTGATLRFLRHLEHYL